KISAAICTVARRRCRYRGASAPWIAATSPAVIEGRRCWRLRGERLYRLQASPRNDTIESKQRELEGAPLPGWIGVRVLSLAARVSMPSQKLTCPSGHSWHHTAEGELPADLSEICPTCTAARQETVRPQSKESPAAAAPPGTS